MIGSPGQTLLWLLYRVVLPSGVGFFGPRVDPVDVLAPFQSTTFDMFELSLPPGFVGGTGLILYVGIVGGIEIASRAANYIDKTFKGANPAHLPVEQPSKLELISKRTTAKQLRLTIPYSLLSPADQIDRVTRASSRCPLLAHRVIRCAAIVCPLLE